MAIFKKEEKSNIIIPQHVAIIMDGNGRWAKKRGLPRTAGHKKGANNFRTIADYLNKIGVKYMTFYAFSTENWKRSKDEVDTIMALFKDYLEEAFERFHETDMKMNFIGDRSVLRPDLIELMYKSKPILRRILTEDGHDAAAEYYQLNPTKNATKDTSPSGFDQEIAGSLCFWLKRYGPEEIIKLMENSKLNRHDKGKEYWINTVNNAYSKAFLYFTATPKLDEDKAKKVQAWRNHKQKLAALMGLKN